MFKIKYMTQFLKNEKIEDSRSRQGSSCFEIPKACNQIEGKRNQGIASILHKKKLKVLNL